ncbi:MAG: Methionyl-tRNA formyltransferase [Ignavibacteriae bacterium]|nr:MAG: Methionyl-tRNA formyltransferase [Ignavibacteriota bacterium]
MRIVFMGTPEFAVPSLKILLENSYDIAAVVTAPDRPQGRGQKLDFSPVKKYSLEKKIRILQPEKLKDPEFVSTLRAISPDLIVVVAFRILPSEVFKLPPLGTFNLHASLLPKYRGAAPINWAIINGEKETGVTTFFIEESVDTGNIILQARVPIGENETAGELHDKLAEIGAEIVLHTVRLIEMGKVQPKPQDNSMATPAPKIFKENCRIDWNKSATDIHNLVRGLSPSPGAFTYYDDKVLKIYRTLPHNQQSNQEPGTIVMAEKKLIVATISGDIEILELQLEGKRKLTAEEFLRGSRIQTGQKFL